MKKNCSDQDNRRKKLLRNNYSGKPLRLINLNRKTIIDVLFHMMDADFT